MKSLRRKGEQGEMGIKIKKELGHRFTRINTDY
jgi:hypothetical protein